MPNTHSIDLERGSTQYLSIADGSQTGLDITGDFTLEAWVKLETTVAASSPCPLISKYNGSGNQRGYIWWLTNAGANDRLTVVLSSDGITGVTKDIDLGTTLSTGTWYHLAIVYTAATGGAEAFSNGTSTGTATGLPTSVFNSSAAFEIGAQSPNLVYMDGLMDEVRVWNAVKTAGDLSGNYLQELTGSESNLQGYWKLNNDLLDATSNNNDLTNNGSATFSTDVPFVGSAFIPQIIFI